MSQNITALEARDQMFIGALQSYQFPRGKGPKANQFFTPGSTPIVGRLPKCSAADLHIMLWEHKPEWVAGLVDRLQVRAAAAQTKQITLLLEGIDDIRNGHSRLQRILNDAARFGHVPASIDFDGPFDALVRNIAYLPEEIRIRLKVEIVDRQPTSKREDDALSGEEHEYSKTLDKIDRFCNRSGPHIRALFNEPTQAFQYLCSLQAKALSPSSSVLSKRNNEISRHIVQRVKDNRAQESPQELIAIYGFAHADIICQILAHGVSVSSEYCALTPDTAARIGSQGKLSFPLNLDIGTSVRISCTAQQRAATTREVQNALFVALLENAFSTITTLETAWSQTPADAEKLKYPEISLFTSYISHFISSTVRNQWINDALNNLYRSGGSEALVNHLLEVMIPGVIAELALEPKRSSTRPHIKEIISVHIKRPYDAVICEAPDLTFEEICQAFIERYIA